ncbi:hypothetical protein UG54_00405 [Gordonia sihwensis]|nr:hypothetical protein UG54_00405 [Gordonia sihwensis]
MIANANLTKIVENRAAHSTQTAQFLRTLGVAAYYVPTKNRYRLLWRGQGKQYRLAPSAHTRIVDSPKWAHPMRGLLNDRNAGNPTKSLNEYPAPGSGAPALLDDDLVVEYTTEFLNRARCFMVDSQASDLPDMALLALLQHNWTATPLLDVTADPMLALLMAVDGAKSTKKASEKESAKAAGESAKEPKNDKAKKGQKKPTKTASVDEDGLLAVIPMPPDDRQISEWETRSFGEVYKRVRDSGVYWHYTAPYVSARLRIQRGTFLLGPVTPETVDDTSTIGLHIKQQQSFIDVVTAAQGSERGWRNQLVPSPMAIEIPGRLKWQIKEWINESMRLDMDYVKAERLNGRLGRDFVKHNLRTIPWSSS